MAQELDIGGARPSDLSIEQWQKLFKAFINHVASDKKDIVAGAENKLKKQQKLLKKWRRTR